MHTFICADVIVREYLKCVHPSRGCGEHPLVLRPFPVLSSGQGSILLSFEGELFEGELLLSKALLGNGIWRDPLASVVFGYVGLFFNHQTFCHTFCPWDSVTHRSRPRTAYALSEAAIEQSTATPTVGEDPKSNERARLKKAMQVHLER